MKASLSSMPFKKDCPLPAVGFCLFLLLLGPYLHAVLDAQLKILSKTIHTLNNLELFPIKGIHRCTTIGTVLAGYVAMHSSSKCDLTW